MIRIKDIADRAGVSPTTVSNVIHGKTGRVSPDTVAKINEILEEMHYVPNISARMLANRTSGLIGVVLGYVPKGTSFAMEDPFVAAIVGGLEYEIRRNGCYMMLLASKDSIEIMNHAASWNLDGIIIMGTHPKEVARLAELYRKPVVAVDYYEVDNPDVIRITMDDEGGGYEMGKYLIGKGHRRILFLADNDYGVDHFRWIGLRRALTEAGIEDCDERLLLLSMDPDRRELQYRGLLPLLRQQTALFCASDYYALELSNFLQSRGVLVPDEVSIVGFDDGSYATLARPRLTTVHQMVDEKARRAVETVLCMIRGESIPDRGRIPAYIVERESVRQL